MSIAYPQPLPFAQRTVSLEGIGSENAITIQRAVELHYDGLRQDMVVDAARMLTRSEVRSDMPCGQPLVEALAPDEAEILADVEARKVLGEAETAYANEVAYNQAAPESTTVKASVAKKMSRALLLMELATTEGDQQAAREARQLLNDYLAQNNVRTVAQRVRERRIVANHRAATP